MVRTGDISADGTGSVLKSGESQKQPEGKSSGRRNEEEMEYLPGERVKEKLQNPLSTVIGLDFSGA